MTESLTPTARPSKFAWLSTPAAITAGCVLVSAGVLAWQFISGQDTTFGQVALLATVVAFAGVTFVR